MTEPTDNELQALWSDAVLPDTVTKRLAFSFARAVLAKWGAPPAVAGEPVAYCQPDDGNAAEAFSWPGTERRPHHTIPLYATPQPTQAQAGAVPLTDEQIDEMHGEANRGYYIEREHYWKAVRDTEAAHGITKGA